MLTAIPAKLEPSQVVVECDTREQLPLCTDPLPMVIGSLPTGDYRLRDMPDAAVIERKSRDDFLCCVGRERERFDREIARMLGYPCRVLLVESTWSEIELGGWRSKVTPAAAIGSLLGWIASGICVVMARDHQTAGTYAARILYTVAKRRYRESRALLQTVVQSETATT